ncbi:AAA family ATPase [Mycobacterium sp. ITM-2016-00318]|uniref:AAA family ATPase n=1 Tax=Mycobacterium sp. ITM-2016-00318 TaxID=2099693 RepID=UPI000CFA70D1|nr:AAA family ATPase [Mycobacterium sp. ITM-2016-00318]WNG91745.1 AAA family ATPase [Mycobacterium sp. ITM-2016-00318]
MPVEWKTAPPEPAIEQVASAVADRGGAVLVAPVGAGKTTVARAAAERIGGPSAWVTGTESDRVVPFAAVRDLIGAPDEGKTAAVLSAARESVADGLLLVVDDAHLLDHLSATLVYQLAVSGAARLIVTVDPDEAAPDSIRALQLDNILPRIELAAPGTDRKRLDASVREFVSSLPADVRSVLDFLAVAAPIPRADLTALAGEDAVRAAADAGVTAVSDDKVLAAHPLYAHWALEQMSLDQLQARRAELYERLSAQQPRDVVDRLRLAVLALDSGETQPVSVVVAAAADALRLGDLPLSERLGEAVLKRDPDLDARLTLAQALAWQGRGREADEVLAAVDPATLSDTELMAWALPRAANQFWMLSQPERATAFLQTTRNHVTSPAARTTVDALSATFAMNAGRPGRAMELAEEVLASPDADDTAVGWSAAAAALSCARMGRFADVDGLADRAMEAQHPGLLRFTSGYGQTTALMMAGQLDRAQELAQRLTDFAQMQQPGRAIGEVLVADVLIARGDSADAVKLLRGAAEALAPTGYSWGPLAWMLLAQALGREGEMGEAAKALSRAESRHGLKSMLFAPELLLAKAWTTAARRDPTGARSAARDAGRAAERGGQSAVAVRAFHDAVRLGDIRAVDAIARLTADVDCVVGDLALRHARAFVAGDADALTAVSAEFADIGMKASAADVAAQAKAAR